MAGAPADPWRALLRLPRHGAGLALPRLVEICRPLLAQGAGSGATSGLAGAPIVLHVAGSNGKGSVASFASEALTALGLRTGLFTSPHLLDPGERIRIGGRVLGAEELAPSIAWFRDRRAQCLRRRPGEETGSFEALTAIALHAFVAAGVEAVVLEAGLGGRLDPTRIAGGRTAALVSVDLEHTELLGDTLQRIALEKVDLCPDGGVLVVGPVPEPVGRDLGAWCRLRRIRPFRIERRARIARVRPRPQREPGSRFDLHWTGEGRDEPPAPPPLEELEIALPGRHQVANAAVAAALVTAALSEAERSVAGGELAAALRTGFGRTRVAGRFERVAEAPEVWVDVAHTPAAARTAAACLGELRGGEERPAVLVVGMAAGKRAEEVAAELASGLDPRRDRVICTRPPAAEDRGAAPERLRAGLGTEWAGAAAEVVEDLPAALARGWALAEREGAVLLIAGSHAVVAAALRRARGPERAPPRLAG